ncbi:MAG: glycosyltransferase [Pedobacter sp.]|nr:MAG: glycosyltransferase [Pedobacter sp.]
MELTLIEICLLSALTFCFIIQLYYSLFVHLKLAVYQVNEISSQGRKPLSVIICARNEAANLKEYLPLVLKQNYPDYEVIVVNDRSWDGTSDLLEEFAKEFRHLKIVNVADGQKFIAGKKFAVTMGIKAAEHDWLVFTDADCAPASSQWLLGMQQPEDDQIEILLGYSPYLKLKGLLNALIRFETFFTAVNYLGFALKGMPYMGVPSGDDDLFVNAHATKSNTAIQINPDAQVWSNPNVTFGAYLRQKKRHFGAGKLYKGKHKFILSFQIIVQFLFYALFISLMFFKPAIYVALGVFILSIIIRSFVYPRLLKRLSYPGLRWWFPVLDILLFIFLVFNSIVSIFVKKVQWK